MTIQEALLAAGNTKRITKSDWPKELSMYIDEMSTCLMIQLEGKRPGHWNPPMSDLLSADWEVVD